MDKTNRYWVYVTEEGKGREFVDSFADLKSAREKVRKFRNNKEDHLKNQTELAWHYMNLDWVIVDMGA